jgi:predicted NUDIX family NTP pyrophosphohydrolase
VSAAARASGANVGSAGLLVYRRRRDGPQVLLAHPGGPFWRGKDLRAWSFPKGRIGPGEEPLAAARREFMEETGLEVDGPFLALLPIRRSGGGLTFCWMAEADLDLSKARSNTFELMDRRGTPRSLPEIDAYEYCGAEVALMRIHKSLQPLLEEAFNRLGLKPGPQRPFNGT